MIGENAIINLLRYFATENALVFCATRATVNHMTSRFTNRGISVVALSGELSQNERSHALQAMRDGRARVCIATDVAARGIDLPNLELVIHADIPRNREALVHRSGRTGRAGRKGVCALIVPHNARRRTEGLLRAAGVEATWAKPPSVKEIMLRDRERILTDPNLSAPMSDDEQDFARELLAGYSAEQIATAYLRQHMAGQTAPEELLDTAPVERKKQQRVDFTDGVWFSLSVGREQHAEPRWLVPMLCRAGRITKRDIGAIKIQSRETYVELSAACVEKFLEAVGPSRKIEKSVEVNRLDARPETSKKSQVSPRNDKKDKNNKNDKNAKNDKRELEEILATEQPGKKKKNKKLKKPNTKGPNKPSDKTKIPFSKQQSKSKGPRKPGSGPVKRKQAK